MAEWTIEDPAFGHRLECSHETAEDGQERVRIEMAVEPGGGVPPHMHPSVHERFEVVEGTLDLLAGYRWGSYEPGQAVDVPPGTRHAYRNRGDEVARAVVLATPPSTLVPFLAQAAALSRRGLLNRYGLPTRPAAVLPAAQMAHRHREMVRMQFPPMPPALIQRVVFPPLAWLADRRGHRPEELLEEA